MGARQRAQKRGKTPNKAAKGSLKGSPTSQKKGNSSLYVSDLSPAVRSNALLGWQDFANTSSPSNRNGFSMTEQARNTERHVFGWGATKLREQTISFVSAGNLNQDNYKQEDTAEAQQPSVDQQSHEPTVDVGKSVVLAEAIVQQPADHAPESLPKKSESQLPPIQNEKDSETVQAVYPPTVGQSALDGGRNTLRHRSLSSSSSEAEQIVFRGRQNASQPPSGLISRDLSSHEVAKHATLDHHGSLGINIPVSTRPIPITKDAGSSTPAMNSSMDDRRPTKQLPGRRGRVRPSRVSDEEEAIMQDYIANMAMDDSDEEEHKTSRPVRKNEHFRFYDGAGDENMKVKIQSASTATPRASRNTVIIDQAVDWDSSDLEDFDEFTTTDEDIEDITQVLRQRERPAGLQYLVTGKGLDASDAKWMLHSKLTSESAQEEIRIFQEIQAMAFEHDSYDDEDESSTDEEAEEALNDLIDNIESEDDENTKILEHTARMTDEQIARVLAKQEELGIGGDELVLFNGDVGEDDDEDMDAFGRGDDFVTFSTKRHTSNRVRSKRNKKQRDSFPSAAAFADAIDEDPYGAFDIMDFDRPSLRQTKKGRKSGYPYDLDLDDDDLKDQLVSTWERDREKKSDRKRQKEEARMTAVLDASERNHPAAIKAEIRRFLVQEIDVLRLAPMDSPMRAAVHRLAKALRLNSRSEGKEGKGSGRFPVLTKTIRTPSYTIDNIWEIDALLNTRKFFPKHAGSYNAAKVPRATFTRSRRDNGGVQGASYMNGEVVGASAPELGADNKGRLLLEKMGWTTGMGIGAVGNKGSVDVIKHVVKTTKAGLG